ncbi:MAG: hypothetical protein IKT37_03665 [Clostridia bacterium]|nr:hypothetical protein [Clostridia bacterium]
MKRAIIILLLLALTLAMATSCEDGNSKDKYEESNYDNISVFQPPDNESENETENGSASPLTGEFTVKDKVYDFRGNNIAIVSVKNGTNKDYSVTIKGSFLDKDGNVLKTETQTLDQYSAGYENYFLFEPNIAFDKFTYEIETSEADGPFFAKYFDFKYNGLNYTPTVIHSLMAQGDYTRYPTVNADLRYEYTSNETSSIYVRWVIMSAEGEIMALCNDVQRGDVQWGFEDAWEPFAMHMTTDQSWKHPEEWKKFSAICVVKEVSADKDKIFDIPYPEYVIEGSMQ